MNDYSALAQRVSTSVTGVRGCLMLSRDGMVLGAHPEGEAETHIRSSWMRFATVGDPERSYVEFPDQIWAFVRRGGYSAFAVADAGVRPGVLVDLLEQALMVGEQDRARDRDTMRLPEAPVAPSGKPRISMHKQERAEREDIPASAPSEVTSPGPAEATVSYGSASTAPTYSRAEPTSRPTEPTSRPTEPASRPTEPASAEPAPTDPGVKAGNEPSDPENQPPDRPERKEEESEVDRILLAKEFAGLLQVPKEDDEASR
jgi:hypothetical protein